ncbi:unnamed protein product [marine sediment metagenome]|uniref:Uncharacterized protein n=1 Tax=marine sediment metagenome TaxID=412755 RepID=X0YI34_9ZZZZ
MHGFAESEPIFPDDSTADQVYNHRQFESFRRLGYHQAEAAIGKRPTDDPDDASGRSDPDTGPPTDTAGAQPPGG